MSKFIKTCRQFVECEYNGTKLYPNYPNMSEVHSTGHIESILLAADNKSDQMAQFYKLLEVTQRCFPVAGTIHDYLEKYDAEWYKTKYSGRNL